MADSKRLNSEQKKAIEYGDGPLLIIAGAGTGKTTVITERIVHLVESGRAKPEEILALTFTEKATQEMEERVDIALPLGYTQMWISTFHSFCDRVLRDDGIHIGLDSKFKLLSQAQSIKLVKDNIFEFELEYFRPLGNPTKFIQGMLTHFSRLQDENISSEDYLKWAGKYKSKQELEKEKFLELANAYKFYNDLKTTNSLLDFGDLIVKTLELFEKRPNVLEQYKEKFKYILIDEFQDTNYAQNLLALKLAGKEGNITVVGDDDQSIYKFRGASVSNILEFRKNYPKTKVIVLTQNYRSTKNILDSAYKLIQNNNPNRLEVVEKINKKLISNKKRGEDIQLIETRNDMEEADAIASQIVELTQKKGYSFSDIAILVRANSHADIFVKTFERLGIPHQFLGPAKLFQQEEIIELISYLRVLYNPHDNLSLTRLLSIDGFGISGRLITDLSKKARDENKSLFEVAEESEEENIKKIINLVNEHIEKKYKEMAGNILYEFMERTGKLESLLSEDTQAGVVRANNISTFFEKLKNLENQGDNDGTVAEVVDWIELSLELGDSPQASQTDWTTEDKVNILTVHSSKGLEFPVVFLVNLVNLRFPGMNRSDQIPIPEELIKESLPEGNSHLQEERRLFYVAMTRAKDILYMSAAKFYADGVRAKKLSPFVLEAGLEPQDSQTNPTQAGIYTKKPEMQETSDVRQGKLLIDRLSYSQIEAFRLCPLHYKLGYILRVPTPDSASLSLGTSVHETMFDVFSELKQGKKLKNIDLEERFTRNWQNRGFADKKHERLVYKKALAFINDYFKNQYSDQIPISLEEKFVISLPEKKGQRPLKISGVIDRVDEIGKDEIEIIDYKTGSNIPSQREVDKNLQLSIYALAAGELYKKPAKLSLYYFEEGVKISTKRSNSELKSAIDDIYATREEIEKSDFACSGHYFCQNCEYSLFCKQDQK